MSATATIDAFQLEDDALSAACSGIAPQHMQALERANLVRCSRAALKRRIAAGDTTVAEVLDTMPWEVERMPIAELLMSQRRWGRARCKRFLAGVPLSENKELGTLTERQRNALLERLNAR